MFILVRYNENYLENILEAKKYNYTFVTVFDLVLDGKENIKRQLLKIDQIKKEIKPENTAIIVTAKNIDNTSVGIINSLRNDFNLVIGMGGLNKTNRFFIEDAKIDFLLDPQNSLFRSKTDFIHHFNSGLNQVLCKMAKEKGVGLIFSLNFTQASSKTISKEIGRINQNIFFARKYKLPTYINYIADNRFHIKSPRQIESIYSLFSASTSQKNDNRSVIAEKIKENKRKKSDYYVAEGIRLAN